LGVVANYPGIRDYRVLSDKDGVVDIALDLPEGLDIRDELFFAMAEKRCAVIHIEQETANLEQIFLSLTDKTQGTPDKRALRDKKRREKMLGNVKEAAPQNNDGGEAQ
jgi:ABC-2 type transport system ATP-binding protein